VGTNIRGVKMDLLNKIDKLLVEVSWYGAGAKGRPVVPGIPHNELLKLGYEDRIPYKSKTGYNLFGQFGGKEYMGQLYTDSVDVSIKIPFYLNLGVGEDEKAEAFTTIESGVDFGGFGNGGKTLYTFRDFIYNVKGDQGKKGMITLMNKYKKIAMKEVKKKK
jgi:hypothetical protein